MSDNHYVGSTIRRFVTVTDPDGVLTNGTVTLEVTDPSGAVTTPVPDNPSTGIYEHYLALTEAGDFYLEWTVTIGSYVEVEVCSVCAVAP